MPKSYELKLREAEERRRPREKEELYKSIENVPQRMMLGFDHPESLNFEMRLTWVEDTWTVDRTQEHLMSEIVRMDGEYKRKPLRANYSRKYLWHNRYWLRPSIQGTELNLQDYTVEPGFRAKVAAYHTSEFVFGQPWPYEMDKNRPMYKVDNAGKTEPEEDSKMLKRLDKGPPSTKQRVFLFPFIGSKTSDWKLIADRLPKDCAIYSIEMPGQFDRELDDGYPNGAWSIEVMAKTLGKEMKKPGSNYFFAHSQGTHFAYYVAKAVAKQFRVSPKCIFVSSYMVPAAAPITDLSSLRSRNNALNPLRMFIGMIKSGWQIDAKLGYMSHMGSMNYQTADLWPDARSCMIFNWQTREFPLPQADEPLDCPITAFLGKDDTLISEQMVNSWSKLTSSPRDFSVVRMPGGHMWFQKSSAQQEALGDQLTKLMKKFA